MQHQVETEKGIWKKRLDLRTQQREAQGPVLICKLSMRCKFQEVSAILERKNNFFPHLWHMTISCSVFYFVLNIGKKYDNFFQLCDYQMVELCVSTQKYEWHLTNVTNSQWTSFCTSGKSAWLQRQKILWTAG